MKVSGFRFQVSGFLCALFFFSLQPSAFCETDALKIDPATGTVLNSGTSLPANFPSLRYGGTELRDAFDPAGAAASVMSSGTFNGTLGAVTSGTAGEVRFTSGTGTVATGTGAGQIPRNSNLGSAAFQPSSAFQIQAAWLTNASSFFQSLSSGTDAPSFRLAIGAGTSSFSGAFSDLAGKPATLAGYGITDAFSLSGTLPVSQVSGLASVATSGSFASLLGKPTTLSGYGITDGLQSSGTLSLGGFSGITGALPVANGGTGTTASFGYIFTNFVEASGGISPAQDKMRIAISRNAKTFGGLTNQAIYSGVSGDFRDPCWLADVQTRSLVKVNGLYWQCHTSGGFSPATNFEVESSPDLVNWTHVASPSVASLSGSSYNVWGPKFVCEPGVSDWTKVHIFVGVNNVIDGGSGHAVFNEYSMSPTNAAMTSWSNPSLVSISSHGTAWGQDMTGTADHGVIYVSGTYHLFYSNSPNTNLTHAKSTAWSGPYTTVSGTVGTQFSSPEGISIIPFVSGTNNYRMYVENYPPIGGIYYSDSPDLNAWSAFTLCGNDGNLFGHGDVALIADVNTLADAAYAQSLQQKNAFDSLAVSGTAVFSGTSVTAPNQTGAADSSTLLTKTQADALYGAGTTVVTGSNTVYNNTTTLTDVPGLSVPLTVGTWEVECAASAGWTVNSGVNMNPFFTGSNYQKSVGFGMWGIDNEGWTMYSSVGSSSNTYWGVGLNSNNATGSGGFYNRFVVVVNTAGQLSIQCAQKTSSADNTTIYKGAWISVKKIQ